MFDPQCTDADASQFDLVTIDPLITIIQGTDRNAAVDPQDAPTQLIKLGERQNVAILAVAL
jgi:hypothetical protein